MNNDSFCLWQWSWKGDVWYRLKHGSNRKPKLVPAWFLVICVCVWLGVLLHECTSSELIQKRIENEIWLTVTETRSICVTSQNCLWADIHSERSDGKNLPRKFCVFIFSKFNFKNVQNYFFLSTFLFVVWTVIQKNGSTLYQTTVSGTVVNGHNYKSIFVFLSFLQLFWTE